MVKPPLFSSSLSLLTPPDFSFWRTAHSHGWCDLPPFGFDKEKELLFRLLSLDDGTIAHCTLRGIPDKVIVDVQSERKLTKQQYAEVLSQLSHCLFLTSDLTDFHRESKRYPEFRWIAKVRAGRLLRSPTVFEDVVKMLCTTNCSWALTAVMVENLNREFGDHFNGSATFPKPEAIAGARESFIRKKIHAGYRSPYLIEFAERVASGNLDVESWATSPLPTEELYEHVVSVKGVGEYAAGNILRLMGRHDYLALDSWLRGKFAEMHYGGRKVNDRTIHRHYARFGQWKGLFLWLEATKDWFNA
ncbi:MAG: Fe-S cluster assembly protein HesB [Bacteroidota bacterium]